MNKDIIQGHWKEVKGLLRQQWGKLTDDQIAQMRGTTEELSGKQQQIYGYSTEDAHKHINEFLKKNKFNE